MRFVRLLSLSAALAAVIGIVVSCSIMEDNGSPANSGEYPAPLDTANQGGNNSLSGAAPRITIITDSVYVQPGKPFRIRLTLLSDTVPNAKPIANDTIYISKGLPTSTDTLMLSPSFVVISKDSSGTGTTDSVRVTNAQGNASLIFTPMAASEGVVELTFRYKSEHASIRIPVTADAPEKIPMITASPSVIAADGNSRSAITMLVKDPRSNNPISGDTVLFTTTLGFVSAIGVTDADGKATAQLTSDILNDIAIVTACIKNSTICATAKVEFTGVKIKFEALPAAHIKPENDSCIVIATLVDAAGAPLVDKLITFAAVPSAAVTITQGPETNPSGQTFITVKSTGVTTGLLPGNRVAVIASTIKEEGGALDTMYVTLSTAPPPPPKDTTRSDIPLIRLTTDSNYVHIGSLFKVNLELTSDTARSGALPLGGEVIRIVKGTRSSSGPDTLLVADSLIVIMGNDIGHDTAIVTDVDGKASLTFSSGAIGIVELTFLYRNELATIRIQVTPASYTPTRSTMISATRASLRADGLDKSLITLQVRNYQHNPIVGEVVMFEASAGSIPESAVTDSTGKASVEFTSDRRNDTATISAYLLSAPNNQREQIRVSFDGATLIADTPEKPTIATKDDSTTLLVQLLDAAGRPIANETIIFPDTMWHGTRLTSESNKTNYMGELRIKVESNGNGPINSNDTVIIRGAGALDTAIIKYSNNTIKVEVDNSAKVQDLGTYEGAKTTFKITYSGTNIGNALLEVSVTVGSAGDESNLVTTVIPTGSDGITTFTMNNPSFSTKGTIYVRSRNTGATGICTLTFKAAQVDSLALVGSPAVINTVNGRAELTAIAYDKRGNRVQGALIAFNLLNGPGGGERIEPPTAVTGANGEAKVTLVAGSIPSFFQDVIIIASDFPSDQNPVAVQSKQAHFTIAGPPASVSTKRNLIEINKYTATYGKNIVAVVSDINGNPVADGTPVTFSAEVTMNQFFRYEADFYDDGNTRKWRTMLKPVLVAKENLLPKPSENIFAYPEFEDINRNGVPDRGWYVEPCDPQYNYNQYYPTQTIRRERQTICQDWDIINAVMEPRLTPKKVAAMTPRLTPKLQPKLVGRFDVDGTTPIIDPGTGVQALDTAKDIHGNVIMEKVLDDDGSEVMDTVKTEAGAIVMDSVRVNGVAQWDDVIDPATGKVVMDTVKDVYNTVVRDTVKDADDNVVWDTVPGHKHRFADFNNNKTRDTIELFSVAEQWKDDLYETAPYDDVPPQPKKLDDGKAYIVDWIRHNNGRVPLTTVLITRTVYTVNGLAENELVYGQTDALFYEVAVWAETNGLVADPDQFMLPIDKDDLEAWLELQGMAAAITDFTGF